MYPEISGSCTKKIGEGENWFEKIHNICDPELRPPKNTNSSLKLSYGSMTFSEVVDLFCSKNPALLKGYDTVIKPWVTV